MPETPKCPKCGSTDTTTKAGTDVRKGGRRVQKWRCKGDDCGHVFVTSTEEE